MKCQRCGGHLSATAHYKQEGVCYGCLVEADEWPPW